MAILIFDYDGTLHDSMYIYGPAVRNCGRKLTAAGLMPERNITDDEIKSYLGLSVKEMWQLFAPDLTEEEREAGGRYIGDQLKLGVERGQARFYDGALQVLELLHSQGHRLVYLSNCSRSYMELHRKAFDLDRYFDEMYCSEEFGWKEKAEIVNELVKKWQGSYECSSAVEAGKKSPEIIAIGDRYKDINIGESDSGNIKVSTIWCAYGFGTLSEGKNADRTAGAVTEIPDCVKSMIRTDTKVTGSD